MSIVQSFVANNFYPSTLKQTSGTSYVNGGGAFKAADKIVQFNGFGTVSIKNFYANE